MTNRSKYEIVLAITLMAAICFSQPECVAGSWNYNASLGAGAGWSNNLYLVPDIEKKTECNWVLGTADLHLAWMKGRDLLDFAYTGRYYTFNIENEDSLWLHDLNGKLLLEKMHPFVIEISETLSTEPRDTSRTNRDIFNLMRRNESAASVGVLWQTSPTLTNRLDLQGKLLSFPGEEGANESRSLQSQFRLSKAWSPLLSTIFLLEVGREDNTKVEDSEDFMANIQAELNAIPKLSLKMELERRWIYESDGNDQAYWLNTGRMLYDLGVDDYIALNFENWLTKNADGESIKRQKGVLESIISSRKGDMIRIGIDYDRRRYEFSGIRETSYGPAAAVRWMIFPITTLYCSTSWRKSNGDGGTEEYNDELIEGSASIMVLISRRVKLEVGYTYLQDNSNLDTRSYKANQAYALATIYFNKLKPQFIPPPTFGDEYFSSGME